MKIIKCICCDKEIKQLDHAFEEDKLNESNWIGGSVGRIDCGYGSSLDGDMFYIGICDDCLISKKEKEKVIYLGNYIFPEDKDD